MDFELRETKKVIIHSLSVLDFESFQMSVLSIHIPTLIWYDDVLMYATALQYNDDLITKLVEGQEEHILAVYATKSDFIQSLNNIIPVNIASSNMFVELSRWIKSQKQWKDLYG